MGLFSIIGLYIAVAIPIYTLYYVAILVMSYYGYLPREWYDTEVAALKRARFWKWW